MSKLIQMTAVAPLLRRVHIKSAAMKAQCCPQTCQPPEVKPSSTFRSRQSASQCGGHSRVLAMWHQYNAASGWSLSSFRRGYSVSASCRPETSTPSLRLRVFRVSLCLLLLSSRCQAAWQLPVPRHQGVIRWCNKINNSAFYERIFHHYHTKDISANLPAQVLATNRFHHLSMYCPGNQPVD